MLSLSPSLRATDFTSEIFKEKKQLC